MNSRAQAFRAAISITANEIRGYLAQRAGSDVEKPATAAALGTFAAGRIDPDRFARLLTPSRPPAGGSGTVLKQALAVLDDLEMQGNDLFRVRIDRGDDLAAEVGRALANAGRAFGAARVANAVRSNQVRPGEHEVEPALEGFPFRLWSKAERNLAPPMVVELAGADMVVAGLAAYLDGNQAIVLLVEGQAPPAPLARLITPGVFVMQSDDPGAVHRLGAVAGPAVVAVMPAGTARFVHSPAGDGGTGHIEVSHLPAQEPRRPLGPISVFQQQQELRLLALLASAGKENEAPKPEVDGAEPIVHVAAQGNAVVPGATAADPVGTLAAWLLARVDLSDLEAGSA